MINQCIFTGRFVHAPELKTTNAGTKVCSFALAVERSYAAKGENRKTDFLDFVAWKGTAEYICRNYGKGDMIAIVGELQTRSFEDKDGHKRRVTEVVVKEASFCGGKRTGDAGEPAGPEYASSGDFEELADDDELPFN